MPRLSTNQSVISWFAAIASVGLGCSFDTSGVANGQPQDDGGLPGPDAVLLDDAGNPLPCTQWRFAPAHFDPCAINAPQGGLSLDLTNGTVRPYYIYDTTVGSLVDPNGATIEHVHQVIPGTPSFRLISVDDFTVGPDVRLRVEGQHPLLVASWGTITVDGDIDASSNVLDGSGAGANPAECGAGTGGNGVQNNGGGGGGGGGFGAAGGAGGNGGNTNNTGGMAGSMLPISRTLLRGGCAGGKGGQGDREDGGGAGGAGGGAIQLTAKDSVSVAGTVHVGGQGGAAAEPDIGANDASRKSGGGGGGSGGMIGIQTDALTIANGAVLAANGGGGGAGSDTNPGQPGDDAIPEASAALGGPSGDGGDGGDGGFRDTRDGRAALQDSKGGGGGGGGVGYIILDGISETIDPGALLSPNRTALPPARTSNPR